MTTVDRFDPFERRIGEALEGIAPSRPLDYLDDVFRQTARTPQRPRWSFPERWFNVDTALPRGPVVGRLPVRPLLLLVLLLALLASAVIAYIGTHRTLAPFGPAANGSIAFLANGDLYVRDGLTSPPRLLIGGPGDQIAPDYSPDGTSLSYITSVPGQGDHFAVARADGSHAHEIALIPSSGNAQAAWAPDSRSIALIYDVANRPQLSIAPIDGGTSKVIDLGGLRPLDIAYQPPSGAKLLVRAQAVAGSAVRLYTINADGSGLRALGPFADSGFGPAFTLSGAVWSPDGQTIAYNSIETEAGPDGLVTHFRVHVMNADGSNDQAVLGPTDPREQEAWPHFSPDGAWLALNHWQFKNEEPTASGWITVMPADLSRPAHPIGPRFPGGETRASRDSGRRMAPGSWSR